MENLKVCILAVFLIFGFVLASSGDIFWLVLYLIGCGVIWCCTRFFKWMGWLFRDDIQRMKRDKFYKQRGWK